MGSIMKKSVIDEIICIAVIAVIVSALAYWMHSYSSAIDVITFGQSEQVTK